nr:hypothetical protein [Tanacetum cinerariifolium]
HLYSNSLTLLEGPGDVPKLWNDHYETLSEDYSRHCENSERVQNMILTDISIFLRSMGKSLSDFDLPNITTNMNLESFGLREVHEEHSIVVEDEHRNARDYLNHDQKHADEDCPGVFFIDGPSDNIPFEIQMEIIEKVSDVKSLIQFRSVSKQWKSLIDSSEFINGYSARHTQPHSRILMYQVGCLSDHKYIRLVDDDIETFNLQQQDQFVVSPFFKEYRVSMVVGECHGLLLWCMGDGE